jgi:hypothetical protein
MSPYPVPPLVNKPGPIRGDWIHYCRKVSAKWLFDLSEIFMSYNEYKSCIDACLDCAAVCNHCASSCLKEADVHMMARCIQLDMECTAICYAAAQLMSLGSPAAREVCRLCAAICRMCAAECEKHDEAHCRQCAETCRRCAAECEKM